MKKLFFTALFVGACAFKPAQAQISIGLNLNIGSQPDWGPTGYDHVDYYYLPDIDCYYDVSNHQYIYLNGRTWTRSTALPARYGSFNLYSGYKVVINQPKPYLHAATYRAKYAQFKGRHNQAVIRDSHDAKYRNNRPGRPAPGRPAPGRPGNSHDKGHPGNGHDNGHDNGRH